MRLLLEVSLFLTFSIHDCISIYSDDKVFVPAGKDIIDFDSNEDILKHERYARHVEVITESVVEHIVKEIKNTFPEVQGKIPRHKLNQVAEDLNAIIQILKQKRIRTRNSEQVTDKKSSKMLLDYIFRKNKFMSNNNIN